MDPKGIAKTDVLESGLIVQDECRCDVAVLGGGMTGLVSAYELAKAGANVVLLEKSSNAGGVITTWHEGDWLIERGPNSLSFRQDDEVHQFINELGLGAELLVRPMSDHDRYIWRGGVLRRVPTSPMQLLRQSAISRRGLPRAALGVIKPHPRLSSDISIGAYFSPLVGRPAVEQLLAPALAGIYAADPFALSLEAVMPKLHKAAMQSTSLAGALRNLNKQKKASADGSALKPRVLASFKNGMSTVTERLAQEIDRLESTIETNFEAASVERSADSGWIVKSEDGRQWNAKRLVCALPAPSAAQLLKTIAPDLASALKRIYYAPMTIVHIGVREADVPVAAKGFGCLAVRHSGVRSLGMIWSDRIFQGRAPEGHRLFTVFLGGQVDPLVNELSDTELLDAAFRDLRTIMKWRGNSPAFSRITRHERAIPLLEVGHASRVRQITEKTPENLWLTGNYMSGVSLPACINAGKTIAVKVMSTR